MLQLYYSGAKKVGDPQSRPEKSLGGFISSSQVVNGELNSLLGDLSLVTQYDRSRQIIGVFLRNEYAQSVFNLSVGYYLPEGTNTSVTIGVVGVENDKEAAMSLLSKPEALPLGVDFHSLRMIDPEASEGAGLILEEFLPGQVLGIWIQREPVVVSEFKYEEELARFKEADYRNVGEDALPTAFELIFLFDDNASAVEPPAPQVYDNILTGGMTGPGVAFGAASLDKLEYNNPVGNDYTNSEMRLWVEGVQVASVPFENRLKGKPFRFTHQSIAYTRNFTADNIYL